MRHGAISIEVRALHDSIRACLRALQEAAVEWSDDVTELVVCLAGSSAAGTTKRARKYDRLVDSIYEWLEASGGTSLDPLLGTTVRQVTLRKVGLLHSSAEAAPVRFSLIA
jgi:hypothetical protein